MIIRQLAARHGRQALSRGVGRATATRGLSSDSQTTSTSPLSASPIPQQPPTPSQPPLSTYDSPGPRDAILAAYRERLRIQRTTRDGVGGTVTRTQRDSGIDALLANPPRPEDVTLELLLASQAHMGHHTSLWNPGNARYLYGTRQGIHVIALEATASYLRRAARVVDEVCFRGGLVLFVGTRQGQMRAVVNAARLAKGCHLFTRWTPGTLTNGNTLLRGLPTKMVDHLDRDVAGLEHLSEDRKALQPDLVVCLNPMENWVLLRECCLVGVPTIGVIDTDMDPSMVTYPIPANDDSLRCIALIAGVLGRAGEAGQKRRLEAAENGQVTWESPRDVVKFLEAREKDTKSNKKEEFHMNSIMW